MDSSKKRCAAVIGSGPNGLAAAIALAEAGCKVRVFEAAATAGGATRTEEVTLPGFRHDLGSAIHPLAAGSPFFESKPLQKYGLEWIHPDAPLAHPLDDGTAVMLEASLEKTAEGLGSDRQAYIDLFAPLVESWPKIRNDVLAPIRMPAHPLAMMRSGSPPRCQPPGYAGCDFKGSALERSLPGWPGTPSFPSRIRSAPRSDWCWGSPLTR